MNPSSERPVAVQPFLDALQIAFKDHASGPAVSVCLDRVFERLAVPAHAASGEQVRVPTGEMLDKALGPAREAGGVLAELAARISALGPLLSWRHKTGPLPGASASFADGHANAMIVGPGGLENRSDVWVGLSLLEPDVRYPDHTHPPEEIYLVLSDGEFRQGENDWFTPGVGGTFHNVPNIVHAMRSGPSAPLLAVWCLPVPTQ